MAELDNSIYYKKGPNQTNEERLLTESLIRALTEQAPPRVPTEETLFPPRIGYGERKALTMFEIANIGQGREEVAKKVKSSGEGWYAFRRNY